MGQYNTVTISMLEYNNLLEARDLLGNKYGIYISSYSDLTDNIYIFPDREHYVKALVQDIKNLHAKIEVKNERIRDLESVNRGLGQVVEKKKWWKL